MLILMPLFPVLIQDDPVLTLYRPLPANHIKDSRRS